MARPGTYTSTFTYEGKRYYCYGKTQKEADRKAIEKQTLLVNNFRESRRKITVAQWAKVWLESYKKGSVSPSWYAQMQGMVDNHIIPYIGDMQMKDVTAADIQRMMNQHSNFSDSHQKKIAQLVLQIFDSAVENDVVAKLPIRKIKTAPRTLQGRTRALSDEERRLTLATAEKYPQEGLFFLIMLYCGLRPGEVSRLKMSDYDKEERILHVRRARKADGSDGSPKSASGTRDVPVPNYLAERLDKLKKKKSEYICTSVQGHPLTKTSQKRLWQKFRRHMDIENGAELFRNHIVQTTLAEDLRPYCYRHTYCTDLQDAGVPITVAQRLMGHSDIKMTAQIYTHASQKSFEDAREKINAFQHTNMR